MKKPANERIENIDQWYKRKTIQIDKKDYQKRFPLFTFTNLVKIRLGKSILKPQSYWDELFAEFKETGKISLK